MTATVISLNAYRAARSRPRNVCLLSKKMAAKRLAELRVGVEAEEATADDLEHLDRTLEDILASHPRGLL